MLYQKLLENTEQLHRNIPISSIIYGKQPFLKLYSESKSQEEPSYQKGQLVHINK